MQEELDRLLFLVSDQSLSLLPEYHQRIKVEQLCSSSTCNKLCNTFQLLFFLISKPRFCSDSAKPPDFPFTPPLVTSGSAVPPVHRQRWRRAAEGPRGLPDQQPRAPAHRAAVRERSEPPGARGERRPAVLFGLYPEHAGGATHH